MPDPEYIIYFEECDEDPDNPDCYILSQSVPDVLKNFLSTLSDVDAEKVSIWFNSMDDCSILDEIVLDTHLELAERLCGGCRINKKEQ